MVTYSDILRARQRIHPYLNPTPLEFAPDLGANIWLKLENANPTHSFKVRGALNAVLSLNHDARQRGLVAASSGNHAQGLAYAASVGGVPAKILMPLHTPRRKVNGVKRWGAEAVLFGENYDEAEAEARRLERVEGKTYISPYNDASVIAGAGTIGLEILDSLPEVRRVIVCVSGGGLIAGVATAIKTVNREIEVVGVNARSAPSMYNYFYATQHPENWDTLAEALSGAIEHGSITLDIARRNVDRMVMVEEKAIADAIRWMLDVQGWMVEGGGAVGVAALLSGVLPVDERPTAIIISGGNIDGEKLRKVL